MHPLACVAQWRWSFAQNCLHTLSTLAHKNFQCPVFSRLQNHTSYQGWGSWPCNRRLSVWNRCAHQGTKSPPWLALCSHGCNYWYPKGEPRSCRRREGVGSERHLTAHIKVFTFAGEVCGRTEQVMVTWGCWYLYTRTLSVLWSECQSTDSNGLAPGWGRVLLLATKLNVTWNPDQRSPVACWSLAFSCLNNLTAFTLLEPSG